MHKRFVANIVSRLLLIVCAVMLLPLAWAVLDDPHSLETLAFTETIVFGTIIAGAACWFFRIRKNDYTRLNAKDGLAIVGLSWIALSALGALPLLLSRVVPSYTDAFFEIASGFTTTGATVFNNIEVLPRGILFWRSLTHWLGGMGIIVLYVALLPALGNNTFQLYKAEAPGLTVEKVEPRIRETAKTLWGVYFLFTFFETVLLMVGGMDLFDALCHTFGTIATGGFSTRNASIGAFNPFIQWVIIVFMLLAGVNFMLHFRALTGRFHSYARDEEFRFYALLILFLVPAFAFVLKETVATAAPFREAVFQVTSILTTTGYTTADYSTWPYALKLILLLLMFIGGCGGSTGGGMKVIRVMLSAKIAIRSGVQTIFPNAVLPVHFNGRAISDRLIASVQSYFMIFMFLFFGGALLLVTIESCDLITGFSASIASLSNIGPGLGQVGAIKNYAWVSSAGKWVLIFLMLAGRLELYAILILFMPTTWKK